MNKFKCTYCGEEFDNPEVFRIHEENCLKHQELNGLLSPKPLDEMNFQELKALAKEKEIANFSTLKKDELLEALKAVEQ
jgi:hypothetical protein